MPDPFIRYEYPKLLDESRASLAKLLFTPVDTIVFVPNATTGINTVLRNLVWNDDGRDEILYFSTIYGGCGKSIDYIVDSHQGLVASREVKINYPIDDDVIISRFRTTVNECRASGKRARICLFDVVSSLPGVRFPFEAMTGTCRELGILSLVDGAQGVGMVHINLAALNPDFFVSNCHKWLHVPRGCAVFYVPFRNQDMISSSLPTSHGYVPKAGERFNPLPANKKPKFVRNFEFVGTVDSSPYLCVKDSIQWREEVLGGEEKILSYLSALAKEGGRRVATILGTGVMENSEGTLTDCGLVNVALPMVLETSKEIGEVDGQGPAFSRRTCANVKIPEKDAYEVTQWLLETLMTEYRTFMALYLYEGQWWVRLSAQVYLSMDDFEWAARVLKEICGRIGQREYI
jgi:hercynylcysteine S-oxide lyase